MGHTSKVILQVGSTGRDQQQEEEGQRRMKLNASFLGL